MLPVLTSSLMKKASQRNIYVLAGYHVTNKFSTFVFPFCRMMYQHPFYQHPFLCCYSNQQYYVFKYNIRFTTQ